MKIINCIIKINNFVNVLNINIPNWMENLLIYFSIIMWYDIYSKLKVYNVKRDKFDWKKFFGRWMVIERDLLYIGKETRWICQCMCDNHTVRSVKVKH